MLTGYHTVPKLQVPYHYANLYVFTNNHHTRRPTKNPGLGVMRFCAHGLRLAGVREALDVAERRVHDRPAAGQDVARVARAHHLVAQGDTVILTENDSNGSKITV